MRMVKIDKLKNWLNLILSKGAVQSLHYFLKLLDSQLSASVCVVGWEGFVESELFGR